MMQLAAQIPCFKYIALEASLGSWDTIDFSWLRSDDGAVEGWSVFISGLRDVLQRIEQRRGNTSNQIIQCVCSHGTMCQMSC